MQVIFTHLKLWIAAQFQVGENLAGKEIYNEKNHSSDKIITSFSLTLIV